MNKFYRTIAAICTMFATAGVVQAASTEDADSGSNTVPGVAGKVEKVIERGANAAARGVKRGASAAANGVKRGASEAANGIERGATATANVAHGVAEKVGISSAAVEK